MAIDRRTVGNTAPKKNVFVRKTGGFDVYKWSPQPNNFQRKAQPPKPVYFCTAKAGTQGEDNVTTYVYNVIIVDGAINKIAYVACNYVV